MGKPRKIKLTVPDPCNQDWDKMTPEGKGRFCKRCSNIITDFSIFTDRELVEYLSNIKGKVCGRFENTQLNRIIAIHEPSNTPIFRKALFGAALAAGIAGTAQSQTLIEYKSGGAKATTQQKAGSPTESNKVMPTDTGNIFKGRVINGKNSQPIANAAIVIQFDSVKTDMVYSDVNGRFSFNVPQVYFNKNITVITAIFGYTESILNFNVKKFNKEINIKLKKNKEDKISKTVGYLMM